MKKTNKLISILLVMAMLLSMAPLSLTAFASVDDIVIHNASSIFTNGQHVIIEAASKAGYSKIKVDGEYLDFSKYKYSDGEPMFTLGNDKYEADLSGTDIKGAYDAYTGDINITMNGGVVDYISGSCAGMTGPVLNGNINITVNGGQLKEIWGAEYGVNGNINITVTGGTITIGIYVLYRSDYTLNGDARVTVTGGSPGLIRLKYGFAELNGKAHLYSSVMRDERINDFDNVVYLYGSNWKFWGDTAAALNGETLVIDADQSLTVANGETFTGSVKNNGTITVKNGGSYYASTKNYGTVYAYGSVGNIDNITPARCIKKVTASGQNVTFNDSEWQDNTFNYRTDYTATLTPRSAYSMPSSVTVKVGSNTLTESDYTYNAATGELKIPTEKITDDTTVSATGRLDLNDSANVVTLESHYFTYTGEPINVRPIVNGNILKENDYTVEYSDPVNAGTGTATITGKNTCTGSVTVEYTIYRASILGTDITLADSLTYNGLDQTMKVDSVVFRGKTFKEGVDYEVRDNVGRDAGVYTLKVVGINNVESSIPMEWEIKTRPVTVTADDMSKTYGQEDPESLSYSIDLPSSQYKLNGSPERDQGENVGVYAINQGTLTNENNPNYDITFVGAMFTIEPDVSAIEGLTVDNVKSSDKAALEAVIAQISNAETYHASEEKIAEWDLIKDNCVEMLIRIESVENQIVSFENDLAKYDIDTVTSDNAADLESFQNSVGKFYNDYYDNLTDEQITKITDIYSAIQKLETRISDVANKITRITDSVNSYNENTVKSSDKEDLELLKADIKKLTDGQNITAEERAKLENLDATADALLAKIAETTAKYDRVIAAANSYDEATVTSTDMDDLTQLDTNIFALALTNNVTSEEKHSLMLAHSNVFLCIQKITYVSEEIKRIVEELEKYVFESVKSDDKADLEQLVADIKALTDTQNLTADERAILETAYETCDKLVAKIDETVADVNRIESASDAYKIDTVTSDDKSDIEKLIEDIKDLTDSDNITEHEREQLNGNETTFKALLDRIAATADEIARIEEAVNVYDEESIKSTDKADLEKLVEEIKALTDKTNITEDERTNLGELDAKLDALIKRIDDTAAEIARIDKSVNGYDKETVTSDDIPALDKLIKDIKALIDGDNITEDEKAVLEANDEAIDELVEKLTEVAEEIKRVDEAVKSYDEETVKSTDSEDLAQLKEDIQNLIDSTNTTENEKTALEEMIKDIEGLEVKIDETAKEIERIENAVNGYDKETVTSDDEEAINKLVEEIKTLVESGNVTAEEKEALEKTLEEADVLAQKADVVTQKIESINKAVDGIDKEAVTSDDKAEIEKLKAEVSALLNSDSLTEKEKTELGKIESELGKMLIEVKKSEIAVNDIEVRLKKFNEDRVTIFWEEDIEALIADIDALLENGNMGEAENAKLDEYKAQAENLIEIIHTPVKYFSLRFIYLIWDCINWKSDGISALVNSLISKLSA